MTDIMVDLESMGVGPNAPIMAIGAVEFDMESGGIRNQLYWRVRLQSSVDSGAVIEPETVLWWMRQSDAARAEVTGVGIGIEEALHHFSNWLERIRRSEPEGAAFKVWGNGSPTDNVMLRTSYERCRIPCPWNFREDACYRTIKGLRPDIKIGEPKGVKHSALDDALAQVEHLHRIFAAMKAGL